MTDSRVDSPRYLGLTNNMLQPTKSTARLLLPLLGALALAGCQTGVQSGAQSGTQASADGGPLQVTATVNTVGDLARTVGGDRVQVRDLMAPGVDPHLYKASARDVRALQGADLIAYMGLDLEGKLTELLADHPRSVAVAEGLNPAALLYPSGPGGPPDPHVWFDPTLWKGAAETLARALSEADPEGAEVYAQNAAAYARELGALDAEVRALLERVPPQQRVLVTAHDAFGYFGERYGLEVRGVQGLSTVAEAGARDVQDLARFMSERRIPAIFVENSVPPRTVNAVVQAARALGHDVGLGGELYSDTLGSAGTPQGTYLGMMRHNARTVADALTGAGER